MIKLDNLTKIYKTKNSKESVKALNKVNLTIGDKGLVFVVGESGSGKSTFLNILGGLDNKSYGAYKINDKKIEEFKSLEDFRNEKVGFVFQEYNLIDNLSVFENIKIALALQQNKNDKDVENALLKVGLQGYENRKINELSGGQKQRVAIARALVKNSEFILADEPTGNLDSKTSLEIFDLLKEISKKKLVIIVSHDKINASNYADRIIEMEDGNVKSDSDDLFERNYEKQTIVKKTKGLGFGYVSKFAFNNIKSHLFKTILSILLIIISITSFALLGLFVQFDAENSIVKTYQKQKKDSLSLIQSNIYGQGYNPVVYDSYSGLNSDIYDTILKNVNIAKGYNINLEDGIDFERFCFYIIEKKEDFEKLGLETYGLQTLENDGVYITDCYLEYLLSHDYKFEQNYTDYVLCVGKQLSKFDYETSSYNPVYKINGVIKTDYKTYLTEDFKIKSNFTDMKDDVYNNFVIKKINLDYLPIYFNSVFYQNLSTLQTIEFGINSFCEFALNNSVAKDIKQISLIDTSNFSNTEVITINGVKQLQEITLSDNEIIVNFNLYNALYNEISYNDLTSHMGYDELSNRICNYSFFQLNKICNIKINQSYTKNNIVDFCDKIIVGVVYKSYQLQQTDGYEIYINNNKFKDYYEFSYINNLIKVQPNDFNDLDGILNFARMHYNIAENSTIANEIYAFEQSKNLFSYIFLSVGTILLVISLLISINNIFLNVSSNKRKIGILKALGVKNKDVFGIYAFENMFTAMIAFVVSIFSLILCVFLVNTWFSSNAICFSYFLNIGPLSIVIMFFVCFIINLCLTFIPIKQINFLTPINCIRNID